ncbi:hypothetical protein Plhal304r1_c058g0145761 [Plasmopara halstedii]
MEHSGKAPHHFFDSVARSKETELQIDCNLVLDSADLKVRRRGGHHPRLQLNQGCNKTGPEKCVVEFHSIAFRGSASRGVLAKWVYNAGIVLQECKLNIYSANDIYRSTGHGPGGYADLKQRILSHQLNFAGYSTHAYFFRTNRI